MALIKMLSVIVPVFNGEAYLRETLASVLGQTRPPDEVIVIDDGSTDRTRDVAAEFSDRIRYLYQPNQGPGAARNHGIHAAQGDLLGFIDSDDLWEPRKLALQEAALASDPELALVFCHMDQFISPDLAPEDAADLVCDTTSKPAPLISCLLARRSAFDTLGLLRTDTTADFVDWYLRSKEQRLPEKILDDLLVHRRLHKANLTRGNRNLRREYLEALKVSLDRRRLMNRQAS